MTTNACIVTLRILKKAMSMYSIPNNDLNLVPSETIYFLVHISIFLCFPDSESNIIVFS